MSNTRLALLSGANPRLAKDGPKVRLASGKWKIILHGCETSQLWIMITTMPFVSQAEDVVEPKPVHDGMILDHEVSAVVQLIWNHRGQERFISVYAEKAA